MTLTIAHRGEPVGRVENTLEAITAAVAEGADMVEVDVRLTRDGVPVLLHDADLRRIWSMPAALSQLSAAEVAVVHGPAGERIPTLAEAADLIAETGRQLMVDLPEPDAGPVAHRLLRDRGLLDRTVFAGAVEDLRRDQPAARVALSWDALTPPDPQTLAFVRPEYFNPHFQLLTAEIADRMHERGIAISVWTVDHPRDMAAVIIQGADAVITNRIADLVHLVHPLGDHAIPAHLSTRACGKVGGNCMITEGVSAHRPDEHRMDGSCS